MDEDTKTLWNKSTNDLTVGDAVKLNIVLPIILIGCVVTSCVVISVSSKVTTKFQTVRKNRRAKNNPIIEEE